MEPLFFYMFCLSLSPVSHLGKMRGLPPGEGGKTGGSWIPGSAFPSEDTGYPAEEMKISASVLRAGKGAKCVFPGNARLCATLFSCPSFFFPEALRK